MLVAELWGLGDVALALPFLRAAATHGPVTLLAKAHAGPLLRRFAPDVELIALDAPWTAFRGKYRLHRWPWSTLRVTVRNLRSRQFTHVISARPDPREHALLKLVGGEKLIGFPSAGSGRLLTDRLLPPLDPHRAARWNFLAEYLGWDLEPIPPRTGGGRHLVIHTGAGQPVRRWPVDRYAEIADRLRQHGWTVSVIDEHHGDLTALVDLLATADRFVGNDSGPGHVAALLGVPTFTLFGSQLPENFAPVHSRAAWIDGAPCAYKPCSDYCRYPAPHCLLNITVTDVWPRLTAWLNT